MTKQIYSASSIHSILLSWIPDSYIFMLDCQFQPVVNRHLKLSNFQNKTIVSMPKLGLPFITHYSKWHFHSLGYPSPIFEFHLILFPCSHEEIIQIHSSVYPLNPLSCLHFNYCPTSSTPLCLSLGILQVW